MKLNRLPSVSTPLTPEAAARARATAVASRWHVGAAEGAEADRRRSLQQELEEIQAQAIDEFEGQEQVLQNAQEMAQKLAALGADAASLVRGEGMPANWHAIDDEA